MKKISLIVFVLMSAMIGFSQTSDLDSLINLLKTQKDSSLRASFHVDSLKAEK